ncbi:hypothetical protein KO566_03925 [Flavobacteriaceae bacterium XHP0103]|uniref:hypothetical protein n=1 Tax=Marixanthotalea marina TaxID=2844359 RepID=UPI002989BE55|nr:hypothetical protein [Marixanthotalea marina]MBU3821198.1 hypothetical protein [Marixanthotalea marina]
MSKKINIKVPCSEANHVCDKSQYNEASLWEKIKLNFHLLYCKACRKYTNNNKKLSDTIKKSNVECMDKKRKECMKTEFEKALKNQPK